MVTNGSGHGFHVVVAALVLIAGAREGILSSERLAQQLGTHPVVLRRLLGPLRATGHLEARSGPGGGWAIARDPADLRLGDLYRALGLGEGRPRRSRLDRLLADADAAYLAVLDRSTLADLLREPGLDSRTPHPPAFRN
jgi:DNA-binding IscR family transcriptional regulator